MLAEAKEQKEAQDAHYFREKRAMSGVPFAPEEQMRALAMRVQKAVATEAPKSDKLLHACAHVHALQLCLSQTIKMRAFRF